MPPLVIDISSDEDEDDVQMLEFHKQTQTLIDQAPPKTVKKLSEAECPICFDAISNATTTFCGHVFCLDCLQKSISSSAARGQINGKRGAGLCPMCRKTVVFKDALVLRLRVGKRVEPPQSEPSGSDDSFAEGQGSLRDEQDDHGNGTKNGKKNGNNKSQNGSNKRNHHGSGTESNLDTSGTADLDDSFEGLF